MVNVHAVPPVNFDKRIFITICICVDDDIQGPLRVSFRRGGRKGATGTCLWLTGYIDYIRTIF